MLQIQVPDHAGSRDQAQELVRGLDAGLTDTSVVIDCSNLLVGTPSFLDEVVKRVLEVRSAARLEVTNAPDRVRRLLERAGENRGVGERLRVAARAT